MQPSTTSSDGSTEKITVEVVIGAQASAEVQTEAKVLTSESKRLARKNYSKIRKEKKRNSRNSIREERCEINPSR